jgi:hypothetical protein
MKKPTISPKTRKTILKTAGIGAGILAALVLYVVLFRNNMVMLFVLVSACLSGGTLLALFMMLPNAIQKRVTKRDRVGYGIISIGVMLFALAGCFATRMFDPTWGTIELASMFALTFGNAAGVPLFLGITIALDDEITDPFLDTRNIPWLALWIAVLIIAASLVL